MCHIGHHTTLAGPVQGQSKERAACSGWSQLILTPGQTTSFVLMQEQVQCSDTIENLILHINNENKIVDVARIGIVQFVCFTCPNVVGILISSKLTQPNHMKLTIMVLYKYYWGFHYGKDTAA